MEEHPETTADMCSLKTSYLPIFAKGIIMLLLTKSSRMSPGLQFWESMEESRKVMNVNIPSSQKMEIMYAKGLNTASGLYDVFSIILLCSTFD
jgi:hypothetical protein